MTPLEIRPVDAAAFQAAIDWAAAEGWNPGLDDLPVFHAADPGGYFIGYRGDVAVSSISVVRYGTDFGFLGFYIVRPDHRGCGIGMATWNAGMDHLDGRTVGLDGVVAIRGASITRKVIWLVFCSTSLTSLADSRLSTRFR